MRYRPEPIPWRMNIFLPSYADMYPTKPRKVSRRQAKRAKLRALFARKHSGRSAEARKAVG